jgi:hypothetical protein
MECNNELYHHGVKGMKWGVRRYQNKDGSLTDKGVKRYAKKGYAQDSLNSRKTAVGKAYDKYTGAHKINASEKYEKSSKAKNRERAERYLEESEAAKTAAKKKAAKVLTKGAKATAEATAKIGMAYMTDQIFYDGMGTKVAKETVKAMGRAGITAYEMARGGYDIKWYDEHGNRVG